jgi:hypothetical protein
MPKPFKFNALNGQYAATTENEALFMEEFPETSAAEAAAVGAVCDRAYSFQLKNLGVDHPYSRP